MARRVLVLAILVLVGVSAPRRLAACGDKFMMPARGFEGAYHADHPGSVVIYVPAGAVTRASAYAKVQALLTRVGHKVTVVRQTQGAAQALAKADIVLVDFSEAAVITPERHPSRTSPVVVVLNQTTKAQVAACKAQLYVCGLKSTDGAERFVLEINREMNRVKALKP